MYRVEALTRTVSVEDLGIVVSPSEPKILTQGEFLGSLCLAELVRQGHLRVSKTSLCRKEVPAKPHGKRKSPQETTHSSRPPPTPQLKLRPDPGPSPQEITEAVATTVKQTVVATLKETVEDLVKSAVDSAVRSAVQRSMSEIPESQTYTKKNSAGTTPPPVVDEVPLFIPSGIVPKETSGEISITSETQTSESLGDSATALKKLRKGASK